MAFTSSIAMIDCTDRTKCSSPRRPQISSPRADDFDCSGLHRFQQCEDRPVGPFCHTRELLSVMTFPQTRTIRTPLKNVCRDVLCCQHASFGNSKFYMIGVTIVTSSNIQRILLAIQHFLVQGCAIIILVCRRLHQRQRQLKLQHH